MSIARTYYCDGPPHTDAPGMTGNEERCPAHAETAASHLPHGFLKISRRDTEPLHFCGWSCITRFAAAQPLPEFIAFPDLEGDGTA